MEETTIKSGQFTTTTKFIEFIGGKGYVNFLASEATIEGKFLSGLHFYDSLFKLKIYEDGTVDLDEVDTTQTTQEERKRLLEIIEEQTLTSYRNRTVINELKFTSVEKVKGKTVPLYLAVEVMKPIERLGSLLDDVTISDEAYSNLDALLNSCLDDEDFVKEIEYTTEDPSGLDIYESSKRMNDYMSSLEDSFSKMKEEKLKELKDKKEKTQKEVSKVEYQIKNYQQSLNDLQSDLKLLEDRIDELQPVEPSVGYYFNVSERQNEKVVLDPEIESLIKDKVSKVKSINVENFMKLFTCGEFHIKLSKINSEGFEIVNEYKQLPSEVFDSLESFNLDINENYLIYMGDLTWSQIVNKMVKLGFEQNPEFDKTCDSNSYHSKTDKSKQTT